MTGPLKRNHQDVKAQTSDRKGIFVLSAAGAFVAGLCCLTPVVLVLLGLASVSAAADLGDVLYGDYKWIFRAAALLFLALALVVYFRKKGICTLDDARRQRNRILNTSLLVLIFSVGAYLLWNYVLVHYWGIAAGLPWAQYRDETWAVPAAVVVLCIGVVLYLAISRRRAAKATSQTPEAPLESARFKSSS